jgi:hypothetical protein
MRPCISRPRVKAAVNGVFLGRFAVSLAMRSSAQAITAGRKLARRRPRSGGVGMDSRSGAWDRAEAAAGSPSRRRTGAAGIPVPRIGGPRIGVGSRLRNYDSPPHPTPCQPVPLVIPFHRPPDPVSSPPASLSTPVWSSEPLSRLSRPFGWDGTERNTPTSLGQGCIEAVGNPYRSHRKTSGAVRPRRACVGLCYVTQFVFW